MAKFHNGNAVFIAATATVAIPDGALVIVAAGANGNLTCALPAGIRGACVGVAVGDYAVGETVHICVNGVARVRVNHSANSITVGEAVMAYDNTGLGGALVGPAATLVNCVGIALQQSAADNDFINCLINPFIAQGA